MLEVDSSANPVLVALDPGGTSGVAMYRTGGLPEQAHEFTSGEIEGRFNLYDTFDQMTLMGVPLVVVCEAFTITGMTAQKSPQHDALYIIGHLEAQCRKLGFPFALSLPANKRFGTDDKLKALGWYSPAHGHANDAARHALHFAVSKKIPGSEDLLLQIAAAMLGESA